jgi:hypothetical protein
MLGYIHARLGESRLAHAAAYERAIELDQTTASRTCGIAIRLGLGADREHGYRNDSCCSASWHRVAVMLLAAGDRARGGPVERRPRAREGPGPRARHPAPAGQAGSSGNPESWRVDAGCSHTTDRAANAPSSRRGSGTRHGVGEPTV